MGFLNPLWLVGMFSASIPLIIHLIGRRREGRVDFSSLRLLREVDRRRNLWLRLKRILLLAIRMAICAGIFLILARPVVNIKYGGFTHAPTGACFLIDDSPSMEADNGKVFLTAKEKILEILEKFDERDEIHVLTTSGRVELGPSNDLSMIKDFIRNLKTSHRIANLQLTFERAKLLLADSKKINKVMYLISDLQAINFCGLEGTDLKNLVLVDVGKQVENVGITDVVSEGLFSPEGSSRLRIALTNFSSRRTTRHIGVWLDGEKLQVTQVELPPNSDIAIELDISVETPGFHSGYVKVVEDDELLFDNLRYFTLQVPAEIPVLIISDNISEGAYLKKALRPKPEIFTPFVPDLISAREILRKDVLSYKVIALNNVRNLDFGQLKIFQKYLEDGGKVCIFLGDRIDVDFYNMAILSEFQAHINPLVQISHPNFVSINKIELTHPIFSAFREKRFGDLSLSRFFGYYPLETLPGQTLAWFGNGKPAVVEAPEKGVIFTSSLGQSDITKRAIFVPLMHRLFHYLAKKQEVPEGVLVGEKFKMETPEPLRSITCVTPEGENIRTIPKLLKDETVIVFSETHVPGIYKIEADGKLLALFPVNIDPQESQTAKLGSQELNNIFSNYKLSTADDFQVSLGLYSYELTKLILWIVLGLVFLELLLIHRR